MGLGALRQDEYRRMEEFALQILMRAIHPLWLRRPLM